MQTTNTIAQPVTQTSNYTAIPPVMAAMKAGNDHLPKNELPVDELGTIQSNARNIPQVTLYNAHGLLTKSQPNSLLGYA